MQIALDIPESLYEKLKVVAESDGLTVEQTLVATAETLVERPAPEMVSEYEISYDNPRHLPRIRPRKPGILPCGTENLNDFIFLS